MKPRSKAMRRRAGRHALATALAVGAGASCAQVGPEQPAAAVKPAPARTTRLLPAEQVDAAGLKQFQRLVAAAGEQKALAPPEHPELRRLDRQLKRILALPLQEHLPRSAQWPWEVALLGSMQVNALGIPPGKLVVYSGLLDKVRPSDDELASLIATLVARLLLDQQRELLSQAALRDTAAEVLSSMKPGITPELAKALSGLQLRFVKRDQVLAADALARKLLDQAGVPIAAQISLIERTTPTTPSSPASDFPSLEKRLAQLQGRAIESREGR